MRDKADDTRSLFKVSFPRCCVVAINRFHHSHYRYRHTLDIYSKFKTLKTPQSIPKLSLLASPRHYSSYPSSWSFNKLQQLQHKDMIFPMMNILPSIVHEPSGLEPDRPEDSSGLDSLGG